MRRGAMDGLRAVAALLVLTSAVEAQRRGSRSDEPFVEKTNPAAFVGFSFVAADPVGDLGLFFDQGFGGGIEASFPIDRNGMVRLRGDLGFLNYGHERQTLCFSAPIGCRIDVDVNTTNNIAFGGIGPEVVFARGAVQPYARASVGFSYFFTVSSLSGHDDYGDDWGSTTHLSDAAVAWAAGGGVRVRMRSGPKPIFLDLGVERRENGEADFLTKGDIIDHADGSITILPNRSEANLMTFRVGFSFGIPGRQNDQR